MSNRVKSWTVMALMVASGYVFGDVAVLTAQAIERQRIDPGLGVCWDQPSASVPTTATMKVRVTYDNGAPIDTGFSCTGGTSPFSCKSSTPAPASVLVPGVHTFLVEGATIDVDGTLSAYGPLVSFQRDLYNLTPPQPGSNGRLVKILQAIAQAFKSLWHLLT